MKVYGQSFSFVKKFTSFAPEERWYSSGARINYLKLDSSGQAKWRGIFRKKSAAEKENTESYFFFCETWRIKKGKITDKWLKEIFAKVEKI